MTSLESNQEGTAFDPIEDIRQHLAASFATPAMKGALEAWRAGSALTWDGVWPQALAPLMAAVYRLEARPTLILVPLMADAESVVRDLEFLTGREVFLFPTGTDDNLTESLLQQEMLQRLQILSRLHRAVQHHGPPPMIVSTLPAILHHVPTPEQMDRDRRLVEVGKECDLKSLRQWLQGSGYHSTTAVQLPGEFTVRGGILDVYPPDAVEPYRIEWFDNEIESIRSFDTVSQRSLERFSQMEIIGAGEINAPQGSLLDFFQDRHWLMAYEPISLKHVANDYLQRLPFPDRCLPVEGVWKRLEALGMAQAMQIPEQGYIGERCSLPFLDVQRIGGELEKLSGELDQAYSSGRDVFVVCMNEGEVARMRDLLAESRLVGEGRLRLAVGGLSHGFELPAPGPAILTVPQLLRRATLKRGGRKAPSRAIDSFLDLREGDLIVHLAHGIGVYRGLVMLDKLGRSQEHLELEFAEGTKIYVPTSKIDLVQRYVGGTKSKPKLAKIGGQSWVRSKQAAQEAVTDMASELLELQAQRKRLEGIAFNDDSIWQHQFDASFPYEETADQLTGISAIKSDMTSKRPMDRLICGDVGFGKTELAMRAAFKAIDSGYQVAVLVPTTVLAEQHYKTFRERMAEFPFDIERLSRFRTGAEQKGTLDRLAKGQIDIIIGTHRLVSKDVQFFNLGLVIVDEEQRFGVSVKERLKQSRPNVDVLTLSATPIPRTLHMSLLGVRDISNLETAPEERMSVETKVVRFDEKLIRQAVLRELNRGGQIYFVHNRIEDIELVAFKLRRTVPEARIEVGHGRMNEHRLEQVMIDFIEHRFDLLLSTTIIESGLDIPNANTIFIDEADHYGLSELHQLRGRVGRYKNQAHCYLLVDRNKPLTPDAARRLHAIEEYSQIGAGFGIAMRDLEIRGAGNLLGTQQSGHIAAVGYELYCQLLEEAVRQMMRQPAKRHLEVELHLPVEGYIPVEYVPDMRQKIDLYRRISRIDSVHAAADLRQEMVDRFGEPPAMVMNLFQVAELRIEAALWSIRAISREEEFLRVEFVDRSRIEQLAKRHRGKLRVLDASSAYWPVKGEEIDVLVELQSLLQPSG